MQEEQTCPEELEIKDLSSYQQYHQERLKPYSDARKGRKTQKNDQIRKVRDVPRKFSTQGIKSQAGTKTILQEVVVGRNETIKIGEVLSPT